MHFLRVYSPNSHDLDYTKCGMKATAYLPRVPSDQVESWRYTTGVSCVFLSMAQDIPQDMLRSRLCSG